MAEVFDCAKSGDLLRASRRARQAIGCGRLVVLPTDTVYGIAADAFMPDAVASLLAAKARTRQAPPPVLIAETNVMQALAVDVADEAIALAEAFWPGPLTLVLHAQPSLSWDLGETSGTVALRIPDSELTRELLRDTGPLAVSSANIHGELPAREIDEAVRMFGDKVAVYLDDGPSPSDGRPSTILDVTELDGAHGRVRVLREGALELERIREVLPQARFEG